MPALLKRLAGPRTCPIVVAQYKDEYRGVGHEEDLHWALVVITDRATLSGPSFQAYAQRRRRRTKSSRTQRSSPAADRLGTKTMTATMIDATKTSPEGRSAERKAGRGDAEDEPEPTSLRRGRSQSQGRNQSRTRGSEKDQIATPARGRTSRGWPRRSRT